MRVDAHGAWLLPGFIDLHVHGAMGHELMDASPTGLEEMARFYASHGVTGFLATTWTASRESIRKARELVEEMQGPIQNGSTLLGVHLEGPYLHSARCGAQEISHIRRAEKQEALQFLDSGVIHLLALAPEFEENLWLIEESVRRGTILATVAYFFGLETLGFPTASALFAGALCWYLGRSTWWVAVLAGAGAGLLIQVGFIRLLGLGLPQGILENLF